jgi:GntR family uxuAB operon transcriptional repressor
VSAQVAFDELISLDGCRVRVCATIEQHPTREGPSFLDRDDHQIPPRGAFMGDPPISIRLTKLVAWGMLTPVLPAMATDHDQDDAPIETVLVDQVFSDGPATAVSDEARLAEYLEQAIRQNGVDGSGRLPTERELVQVTGMNRSTIRKALTRLEVEGRIVRHVGRGTFVSTQSAGTADKPDFSPIDVLAARKMLEPRLAASAALAATPVDLARICDCHNRAEATGDYYEFEFWDSGLHRAIAEATHNPMLWHIAQIMDQGRRGAEWGNLQLRDFSPERRLEYLDQHRRIVDALLERDPTQAAAAMQSHLTAVQRNLLDQ